VQRLDILIVDEKVVIECKVVPHLEGIHKAQTFSYKKTVGAQIGLLLNFGGAEPEFERLYFDPGRQAEYEPGFRPLDELPEGLLYPDVTGNVLGAAIEVHRMLGPGFIHRIYANACYYEYRLRDVGAEPRKEYQVIFQGESIGALKFNHFVVEGSVVHFPVAIRDIADLSVHNLKDWMRYKDIRLGVVTNFYDTVIHPLFLRL
jgi:GxxExxY protein